MGGSSLMARIITAAIGVVMTPIALTLIVTGGDQWLRMIFVFQRPDVSMLGPSLIMLAGAVLLAAVVLTGIWSSAGLIAAGIIGIPTILLAMFPPLLLAVFRPLAQMVTIEAVDGLAYGLPLVVLSLLGFMGLVAAFLRRRPASGSAAGPAIGGAVVAVIGVSLGLAILLWGLGSGQYRMLRTLSSVIDPVVILAVLGGVILLAIGVFAARWSPYALVLPAVILFVLAGLTPTTGLFFALPGEFSAVTTAFFAAGGGLAAGVAMLAFTVVVFVIRRRGARRAALDATGAMPAGGYPYPPQAPPAQPYPPQDPAAEPYPPQAPPAQ